MMAGSSGNVGEDDDYLEEATNELRFPPEVQNVIDQVSNKIV